MAALEELAIKLTELKVEMRQLETDREMLPGGPEETRISRRLERLGATRQATKEQLFKAQRAQYRERAEGFRFRISELCMLAAAVIAALEAVSDPPDSAAYCLSLSSVLFLFIFLGGIVLGYRARAESQRLDLLQVRPPEFVAPDFGLTLGVVLAGSIAILGILLLLTA